MTELIQRWIQGRLGILLDMAPEKFAEKAKDGHLLAQVLKSYEIITQDQLNFIEKTDCPERAMASYQNHIVGWLKTMGIFVDNEELSYIVEGKGTSALNLFYQLYLELQPSSSLHYITEQRLKEKLRPENNKFKVQRLKEHPLPSLGGIPVKKYALPLVQDKDIIHWQKDKIQMLQAKCKEARQDYMQYIRSYQPSKLTLPRSDVQLKAKAEDELDKYLRAPPTDMTYEELIMQRDRAKRMDLFKPNVQESKRILRKLQNKQKEHSENIIFKLELQRDIYTYFWQHIHEDEDDHLNKRVSDALLKQSLYEKQMHQKIEDVKFQKHIMLENKRNEAFEINKQMEAEFVHKMVSKEKDLNEKEVTYYLERDRVAELHKKLYEKKRRLKRENDFEICQQLVNSLVNIACNEVDYVNQVGEEPPRRLRDTWKKMFSAGIPFDNYLKPIEIIMMKPEDRPENMEHIVHLEIERQEKIDKKDMESYMEFDWPWLLNEVEIDENGLEDMTCALNILGNIVHNLLAVKYPNPPLEPKPNLPNISIAVCINSLDSQCLPVLQNILDLKDVLVVEMQDCINFCVNAFIQETTIEAETSDDKTPMRAGKAKGKGGQTNGETEERKIKKGAKSNANKPSNKKADDEVTTEKFAMVEKAVQTPRLYPDEKIPLSVAANLGNVARNLLESGDQLSSQILMAMFVQYLKSKPEIKGWVLANYPKTFEEAAVLEETFTGFPVPRSKAENAENNLSINELTDNLEEKPSKAKDVVDELKIRRRSKILPQPVIARQPEFYDSALTAYIKVIKQRTDRNKNEDINSIFEDIEETADPLDRFYADLGCNYHFKYQKIDFNSIKCLAKLVLGDYSIPPKTSVELFGESINYLNVDKDGEGEIPTIAKKGEKKKKPKEKGTKSRTNETSDVSEMRGGTDNGSVTSLSERGKMNNKGKKGKKDKSASRILIVHVDKYTQIPEEEEEEEPPETPPKESENLPKPGEEGWEYVSLPMPEKMQVIMASFWENAEEVYLTDMEQVFFLQRVIMNAVMPFVNAVKEHMNTYMVRPDEKQSILREFQKSYNDFEDEFRNDDEFKAELHCRINQMREKLIEISDWKMIAADHERVFIINKNWVVRQVIQLTNNSIVGLQLELDRFADTLVLLGDYYTGLVAKVPNDVAITKELLTKLDLEDQTIAKAINSLLQYFDESEETVLHQMVENIVKKGLIFIENANNFAKSSMKKIRELLDVESRVKEKSRMSQSKEKEKKTGKVKVMALADLEIDEDILVESARIFDEWNCAIRGEVTRVKIRVELLKIDLFRNLDEALGVVRRTFYSIYDEIRVQHAKELDSINAVCTLLGLAVEREVSIQEELILDRSEFYIDPEVILYPDKLPPVRPLEESVRTGTFAISQLDKMVDIFSDLSPSGYMPERSFSYLLQDFISSNDDPILVPQLWQKLQPRQVDKISKHLFDDIEYVQWKDFIIHNLMLPYPTECEIFQLKKAFRSFDPDKTELITDYQYTQIKFWFEANLSDEYRLKLIRQLIFKLYRVSEDKINYTALLLDFCKDSNPLLGFAKALTVCTGDLVCWDTKLGEQYLEMREKEKLKSAQELKRKGQLRQGLLVVNEIISEIIDNVFANGEEKCSEVESICKSTDEEGSVSHSGGSVDSIPLGTIEVEEVPAMAYFLPLESLIAVITTCLPWHARVQNIGDQSLREVLEELYNECRNANFDNMVLCHEYLNHPVLIRELDRTCKFTAKNPLLIVEDMVGEVEEPPSKFRKHW